MDGTQKRIFIKYFAKIMEKKSDLWFDGNENEQKNNLRNSYKYKLYYKYLKELWLQ